MPDNSVLPNVAPIVSDKVAAGAAHSERVAAVHDALVCLRGLTKFFFYSPNEAADGARAVKRTPLLLSF